ncbi:hypothetical protein MKW92_033685 [Papaver armeniacum]|nr:hypothetical protein MKW92_033685 [Papaver armeniacum]
MEEKVGLGIRNWDFSKQTVTDHAVLKPVSGIPVSSSTTTEHQPHPHHYHQHHQHQQHQHQHQHQHQQQHQLQLQHQHQHQHQHLQQHPHPHPHPQPLPHLHPQEQQHQHHQAAFLKMGMYPNRHSMISESETDLNAVDYANHCWVHQRSFLPPTKASQTPILTTHINTETGLPVIPTSLGMPIDGPIQDDEFGTKSSKTKKQSSAKKSEKVAKVLKTKEPKKKSAASTKKKGNSISTAIREKKNLDIIIDGSAMDFSQVPTPVCSCTGMPRQCYRWGAGGWQSSCCTTNLSEYPLPMSTTRPGSRLAGRKMSNGAYGKLLQRLTVEGYDLSHAIDLKDHWAKHGTNKFVTIK